jgi:hypothetical protein
MIFQIPFLPNRKYPSPNSSLSFLTRLSDFEFPSYLSLQHISNSSFCPNNMPVSYYILYTVHNYMLYTVHNYIPYTTCSPCSLYKVPILKLRSNCTHDHSTESCGQESYNLIRLTSTSECPNQRTFQRLSVYPSHVRNMMIEADSVSEMCVDFNLPEWPSAWSCF